MVTGIDFHPTGAVVSTYTNKGDNMSGKTYINVKRVQDPNVVIIDKTTGTVLGTNIVLAYIPDNYQHIIDDPQEILLYAEQYGVPVYVEGKTG